MKPVKSILASGGNWLRHPLNGRRVLVNRIGVFLTVLTMALLTGCKALQFGKAGVVPEIMRAQTPGEATGAGATITGPANSAAPTTQVSERRAAYFPPFPAPAARVQANTYPDSPMAAGASVTPLAAIPQPQPVPPAVSATYERTETTFGQHQSATGIVKAAASMESWSMLRWIGVACVLFCVGGLLWSHNNPDGYPVIFWKVGGCGLFFLLCSDNPLWLLLLLLPAAFYAIQKFNLWKLP